MRIAKVCTSVLRSAMAFGGPQPFDPVPRRGTVKSKNRSGLHSR